MNVTLVEPNIGYSPLLNLGLAYIISSVERKHSVRLIDLTFQRKNYLRYFKDSLLKEKPDLLGFSITNFSLFTAVKLAEFAKKIYPDMHVIFGGPHTAIAPEEVIQQPVVDSICLGEGESSFLEFLEALEQGREPHMNGIWFKDRAGQILRNPMRPFETDLESIPLVNWDYFDVKRYLASNFVFTGPGGLTHFSSRGCFYNCNFCSVHVIKKAVPGTYYRVRDPEKLIEEIQLNIKKYWKVGFRGVSFHDALFGAQWQQFEKFCSLYIKAGLHKLLPWSCATRAEFVTERWARLAAQAGCVKVNLGVETANEQLRRRIYNKPLTNKQIESAVNNLEKNDIFYVFFFMMGFPEETRETVQENFDFIRSHCPIEVRMPFCQPLPKTDYTSMLGRPLDDSGKELALFKGHDLCRAESKYLSTKELKKLMLQHRFWWISKWLMGDLFRFGPRFVIDILKYICNIKGERPLPLLHPYTYKLIKAHTHLKYSVELWKKRHGFKSLEKITIS